MVAMEGRLASRDTNRVVFQGMWDAHDQDYALCAPAMNSPSASAKLSSTCSFQKSTYGSIIEKHVHHIYIYKYIYYKYIIYIYKYCILYIYISLSLYFRATCAWIPPWCHHAIPQVAGSGTGAPFAFRRMRSSCTSVAHGWGKTWHVMWKSISKLQHGHLDR